MMYITQLFPSSFPNVAHAPEWRNISEGLNIFGICSNKKCKAFQKEIIVKAFKDKGPLPEEGIIFNMLDNASNIRCPICNKMINPKSLGFYNCEYQIIGKKIENEEEISFDSKTNSARKNISYFELNKRGDIKWTELKIYVLPINEIK